MPTSTSKPPKYSLHKPTGQTRIQLDGKSIYLGVWDSPESHKRYAEEIAKLKLGPKEPALGSMPAPGEGLSVGRLVLAYFNQHVTTYYRKGEKPTSEVAVIRAALRPLKNKRFADIPADQFGPLTLEIVRNEMTKLGWSRNTVNRAMNIVRRAFRWATSKEMIPGGIVHALESLTALKQGRSAAKETGPVGPVTDEHVEAVLGIASPLVVDICRLMRLTGMRPGEALSMRAAENDRTRCGTQVRLCQRADWSGVEPLSVRPSSSTSLSTADRSSGCSPCMNRAMATASTPEASARSLALRPDDLMAILSRSLILSPSVSSPGTTSSQNDASLAGA